jgi:hypothetical protein
LKTLKQIAPIWAQRIKSGEWVDYDRELHEYSQCIVGEAWHYTDEYIRFCNECNDWATALGVYVPDNQNFEWAIEKFEQHFNKEHLPQ